MTGEKAEIMGRLASVGGWVKRMTTLFEKEGYSYKVHVALNETVSALREVRDLLRRYGSDKADSDR